MKTFSKIILSSSLLLAGLSGCKFDEDINRDPVNPIDAPMSALLTTSEVGIAYTVGGNIARYNGSFVQHLAGIDRQALTISRYNIGQQDTDDPWDNMYRFMKSLKVVIEKSDQQKSPHYKGVSQILLAYSLGTVTDQWGDVPYSDAFKGKADGSGIRPKYDKQKDLYDTIQVLLTQGIRHCRMSASVLKPAGDDVVYQGNMKKWVDLAFALKARYHLHTAKKNANAYSLALAFADSVTKLETASVGFPGTAAPNENPFFQFNTQRGDVVVASTLVNYLKKTTDSLKQFSGDPRISALTDFAGDSLWLAVTKKDDAETDTLYRVFQAYGAMPGVQDFGLLVFTPDETYINVNYPGPFLADPGSSVPLFLASELDFIKAEAYFALGQSGEAATAFNDGVARSIAEMGVDSNPEFIATYGSESGESINLEKIMNQKWVAMFSNAESWTDWRRTGFPVLTPAASNSLNDQIPRRYPYPQKERTLNSANVPDEGPRPALTKVWWDS